MKKVLSIFLALAASGVAAAQTSVDVFAVPQNDNSLAFFADIQNYPGTVSVELILSNVRNSAAPERTIAILHESRRIMTLTPIDPSQPATADYTFNWLEGAINSAVVKDFVYRLPFAKNVSSVPLSAATSKSGMMMMGNVRDYKVWQFPLRSGDTVFAARAGKIVKMEGFDPASGADGTGTIVIEHADGTMAEYTMLDAGSPLVAVGKSVWPDTALGRAGLIDGDQYGVRLAVYYYVSNANPRFSNMFFQKVYIDPVFAATSGAVRLTEGQKVTAKVKKSLVNLEKRNKCKCRK